MDNWQQLFLKKEDWQKNTFYKIKNSIISAKDNRFVRYENSQENHLVMVYGNSQVGKTTLILSMIGLKDEYFQEVYETLRAGVPRGDSSTSTAIIYSKSVNDQYGCSVSAHNDLSFKQIDYYDKLQMIEHLKKVRNDVENGMLDHNNVLYIYIPSIYFLNDNSVDNISIMDMPGVGSRNHKEDFHIQNLMTKYIPISSVCIIACTCNEIQELETVVLPNNIDWKRMEHRFVLVVTRSYTTQNVKQYFKDKRNKRKESFYTYVKSIYIDEIKKILGIKSRIEVYPIDVGDSYDNLCKNEIKSKDDVDEIIETRNKILYEIRETIKTRKGERLKSALADIQETIQYYGENEITYLRDEIQSYKNKIEEKKRLIKKNDSYIEMFDSANEQEELQNELNLLEAVKDNLNNLKNKCLIDYYENTKLFIAEKKLYKSNRNYDYLKDKKQELLNYFNADIINNIQEFLGIVKAEMNKTGIKKDDIKSGIEYEIDLYLNNEIKPVLYPIKSNIFQKKERVYSNDILEICKTIQNVINGKMNTRINLCIKEVDAKINGVKDEIGKIKSIKSKTYQKIKRFTKDIEESKTKVAELENRINNIEATRSQDQETLDLYMKFAKEAYLEQRNDVIKKINSNISRDEKMLYVLFLGLLDKDYRKVTGGINCEKGN